MRWHPLDTRLDAILNLARPLRNLTSRREARRTRTLLSVLDRWAQDRLNQEAVHSCAALACVPWQRPVDAWRGDSVRSLAEHLLATVRYPLPEFLWGAVLTASVYGPLDPSPDRRRAVGLLSYLGSGGNLLQARHMRLVDPTLTRRACHLLWTLPKAHSLVDAERLASVLSMGGASRVADAVATFVPPRSMVWTRAWSDRLAWLCTIADGLDSAEIPQILDWLAARRTVPRSRSVARIRSEVAAWHLEAMAVRRGMPARLPRAAIDDEVMRMANGVWRIRQLCSYAELVEEGTALHHCVATYVHKVQRRVSAIFGLRLDGSRRLTVEVHLDTRSVVQARGLRNRCPTGTERRVLQAWCAEAGLTLRAT